jgi:hypothetical protein
VQKAKEGDVAAAKLVLAYAIGKPTEAVNPDTVDLEEWRLHQLSKGASKPATSGRFKTSQVTDVQSTLVSLLLQPHRAA